MICLPKKISFILVIILIFSLPGLALKARAGVDKRGEVWVAFFGNEGCEKCEEIKEYFLPELFRQYPQLRVQYFELDDLENYKFLLYLEEKYHHQTNESPVFVIGEHILAGKEEIEQKFETYLQYYLKQGGCSLPQMEKEEENSQSSVSSPPIYLALITT